MAFAMPHAGDSLDEIKRALTVLASKDRHRDLYRELAARAGLRLDPAGCWLLLRVAGHEGHNARDLATALRVRPADLRRHLGRLMGAGLVAIAGEDDPLELTGAGRSAADQLLAARRDGLAELLEGWSPEQYEEIGQLIANLARDLLSDDRGGGMIDTGKARKAASKP